jgi:hypothetical protein
MTRLVSRALSALALSTTLAGAQHALPDAQDLFRRHLTALGGADVLRAQRPRYAKGTLEIAAQGISGTIDMWTSPAGKLLAVASMDGIGEIRSGFDGTTAWSIHPLTGPVVLTGRQRDQLIERADPLFELHLDRYVASATTVEHTQWEGKPCFRVQLRSPQGESYQLLYDAESGLLAGAVRTIESPAGPLESHTAISDYRSVDGLKLAAKFVQRIMGIEQVITFTAFSTAPFDSAVFAVPAAIQALRASSAR